MRAAILSVTALMVLGTASAYCAPGYAVVKRQPVPEEVITPSNPAGWLVTTKGGNSTTTLYGPNGYRRDISAFLPNQDPEAGPGIGGIFPIAVDADGTVYLGKNAFAPGTVFHIGDKLFKLPLNGATREPLVQPEQVISNYAINKHGQIISCDNREIAPGTSFAVRRFAGSELKPISVTFPFIIKHRKKSIVTPAIDTSGTFVVYATLKNLTRRGSADPRLTKLTGLCVGSMKADQVQCLTPEQIKNLSSQQLRVETLTAGSLILRSSLNQSNRFVKIDLATLNTTGSFRLPEDPHSHQLLFASDGTVAMIRESVWPPAPTRLTVVDALNNRRSFSCDFGERVSTFMSNMVYPSLIEGIGGSLLVVAATEKSRSLYQLIPTDLAAPYPGAVGQCVAK